jgi:hypothetical protein
MDILTALLEEEKRLIQQLATVRSAIGVYTKGQVVQEPKKGTMSAKGRRAVAKAQRERWAKFKAAKTAKKKT